MKSNHILLVLVYLTVAVGLGTQFVAAQNSSGKTYLPIVVSAQNGFKGYVWDKLWITPNSNLSAGEQAVRDELKAEIDKVLAACCTGQTTPRHLGSFYVAQGFLYEDLYWLNPGETVLVLSETLEFLTAAQRAEVIRYLKFEMQSATYNPLTYSVPSGMASPLAAINANRSFYPALPNELGRGSFTWGGTLTPPPENLYAAWAFAHYVSQFEDSAQNPKAWQIIQNNWANIEALYQQIPATPRTYWQIMGLMGYARMAKALNKPYTEAEQRAITGFTSGANYTQFYYNMGTQVGCFGNDGNVNGYQGVWDYCAFAAVAPQSLHPTIYSHSQYAGANLANRPAMFAPEIGRFLREKAQTAVVNHLNRYQTPSGAAYFPFWWENKGTKPWAVRDENTGEPGNAENAMMHPSFAWQMFMLRATVFPGETGDNMRKFLDTPIAIGDNFHLQKLVTLLRLYSTMQWAENDPTP
jgi:hypothetical protein